MKAIIQIMRPQQWAKNLFIFTPLFFNKQLNSYDLFLSCIMVVVSFSLASSSIYCFNDILDVEFDKQHPKKCKRPIASGHISISKGYLLMASLIILSITNILLFVKTNTLEALAVILFYYILNILYCLKLKQLAIVDVFIIASGFVLRVLVGGISTNIVLSHWLILMTFLLALFLSFAKRRDDVLLYEEKKYNSEET